MIFKRKKRLIIEIMGTMVGAFLMAFATSQFLLPNQLSSGGFAGIATIIYYFFNIPMGTSILMFNVPLFLFAGYKLGKSFLLKSIIGTISFSIFIDILDKLQPLTDDRFLACIYGGIIIGMRNSNYFKSKCINWRFGLSKYACKIL